MKSRLAVCVGALSLLLLAGCASLPTGPSVMALPGSNKSFEQFRGDDYDCRQYALSQVGGTTANQTATESGVRSAAVGTAVGAVAGAAIGGHEGAGVGAGTGLLMGSMIGTEVAQNSAYASQRHYDNAYIQCMYAKGEQVPVPASLPRRQGGHAPVTAPTEPSSPATGYTPPPPPPGYPAR